jgi:hypothetical protein
MRAPWTKATAPAALLAVAAVLAAGGVAAPQEAKGADKVTLCHATGNGRWNEITVSVNAVSGHENHANDIIPAFTSGSNNGHVDSYPGKNLDTDFGGYTGAEILGNGCRTPTTPPPELASLTVIVEVVNNSGGTKQPGEFTVTASGNGHSVSFPGQGPPGWQYTGSPGSYTVTQSTDPGYTTTYSSGCRGTLGAGDDVTCVITNDDKETDPPDPPDPPWEQPATLTVIVKVINDDGGTATPSDFTVAVTGVDVIGSPTFPGSSAGTTRKVSPGTYAVRQSTLAGYTTDYSPGCDGTIAADEHASCTIVNNDIPAPPPATLTVRVDVVNDNGGTATPADFTATITGVDVIDGSSSFPGSSAGTTREVTPGAYAVEQSTLAGYTTSYSAGCVGTVFAGDDRTCTITNNDIPPAPPKTATLTVHVNVVNDEGGTATSSDFTVGISGVDVIGSPTFPGSSAGTAREVLPGTYEVRQSTVAGYTTDYSAGCAGTIAAADSLTCTITNHDVGPTPEPPGPEPPPTPGEPATLTVVTEVDNRYGGTRTPADFVNLISGTQVTSGAPAFRGEAQPGVTRTVKPGDYAVFQTRRRNYTRTYSDACTGTIAAGQHRTCVVHNRQQQLPASEIYDLEISKSGTSVLEAGASATWDLDVGNLGEASAPGVIVATLLPSGFRFVAADGAPCAAARGAVACRLGTMAKGARSALHVTARAPDAAGTWTVTSRVVGTGNEVHFANNVARATVTVTAGPPSCPPGTRLYAGVCAPIVAGKG